LPSKRLDPKHELTNEHVTIVDIAKKFGNVKTFKTTNPLLPSNARNLRSKHCIGRSMAQVISPTVS
jgi:hypothetical protein